MPLGFAVACKKFFGMKPDQTLAEFSAEIKALTAEDRTELAGLLSVEFGEEVKP